MGDPQELFNAVLMITHPDQYVQCVKLSRYVMSQTELVHREPRVREWPSVFTGISVISNRLTGEHHDVRGTDAGLDLLACAGDPEKSVMDLCDLGIQLKYNSGTVVLLASRVVWYAVHGWERGDRVCFAQWMRARLIGEAEKLFNEDMVDADGRVRGRTPWATVGASYDMLGQLRTI